MLYTRKGDSGETGIFGCDQRFSKNSPIIEALGSLDEANSFLGLCKVLSEKNNFKFKKQNISDAIQQAQEIFFIIQSQIAGSNKIVSDEKIIEMENLIGEIEKELPPIKSFFISGGVELSATLDFARTLARRAERRVVAVSETKQISIDKNSLRYLNRLSSLLYAMARLSNFKNKIKERIPRY